MRYSLLFGAALALAACGGTSTTMPNAPRDGGMMGGGGGGGMAANTFPDFKLLDVNATSATFNQEVSPRDFLQKVSGWYFGHAT